MTGGAYTASLTVTDLNGATSTKTMPALINVYDDEHVDGNTIVSCVTNSAELQSALTTAQSNSKNNVIRLVQGTYGISGNNNQHFSYSTNSPTAIVLKGGYTAGCTSRVSDPTNTILDGEGIDNNPYLSGASVLDVYTYGMKNLNTSTFTSVIVDGITIKNG